MQINKKKLERQQKGVNLWFDCYRGALHYFTGVGKTYTAILIIKRLFRLNSMHNIVVIVPSEELVNQWTAILEKNFNTKERKLINVFTPHYIISNNIRIKTNTLIVDELHEYLGDTFFEVINGTYIQFDSNLGLTATYEDNKGRHTKLKTLYPIIDEITESTALKEGYISPFLEFNLGVEFSTEQEELDYKAYSKEVGNCINKFGNGGIDLATKCLGGGVHTDGKHYPSSHFIFGWAAYKGWHKNLNLSNPADAQINSLWNPRTIFGYASKLMAAIRKRKNLLYNAEVKIDTTKEILFKFPELKSIVFSQSTAFADKLNLSINIDKPNTSVVYHSQLQTQLLPSPKTGKLIKFGKSRLRAKALEEFRNGSAKVICTASSLDKGFDEQDTGLGITASGTANFTQYKQRGGRVKRIDVFNSDKVAILVNLYIKNTKDEAWLRKRQAKATHHLYWVDSIDEISFNPVNKSVFTMNDL